MRTPRRTIARAPFVAGLSLLLAAGCADPTKEIAAPPPVAVDSRAAAGAADAFYYHRGERIPLELDGSRLVLATEGSGARSRAADVLESLGMPVQASAVVGSHQRHEIITLSGGASAAAVRSAAARLRGVEGVTFASPAYRTADEGHDFIPLDRIMVEFEDGVGPALIDEVNRLFGTRTIRAANPDSARFFHILAFPDSLDGEPMELVARLYEHDYVKWADVEKVTNRRVQTVPTDPYYQTWQYYLYNTYRRNNIRVDINPTPAWARTLGGGVPSAGGITVAVIDDGVDASHPDLNVSGLGYDLFGNNTYGCTDCARSPYQNDTHGTSVAGIIGAQHNGVGSAGIAPAAHIVPIRIFRRSYDPNPNLTQYAGDAAAGQAIDFAWYLANADVINNSWGGGSPSDAITSAIQRAVNSGRGGLGTVVVFSVGNNANRLVGNYGSIHYPANLSLVLPIMSVGAINRYGGPANYSPRGNWFDRISIVAPSGNITGHCVGDVVTTDLSGAPGRQDGPSGTSDYTSSFSGTSAAAPQVSGAAALVISEFPSLTATQVIQKIKNAADGWGSTNDYGAGKLNIGRMFPAPPPPPPPPPECEPPLIIC